MDVPETLKDEVRELIAGGWTPPPRMLEPYRHMLKAFYTGCGWPGLPMEKMDNNDCRYIVGLLVLFDHFDIPLPEPKTEPKERAGSLMVVPR